MTAAVFVDSSVWIDHLRGAATPGTRALRRLLDALDLDAGEGCGKAVLSEICRITLYMKSYL